jgi:hypothetical protein
MYDTGWFHQTRDCLGVVRNLLSATRTGLDLQATPEDLLPDVEQALVLLTGVRDDLARMREAG